MFFFPFQIDLRMFRVPVLTIALMALCTLIYYAQSRSDKRWNDAEQFACDKLDDSMRWLLQQRAQSCDALAEQLIEARDPQGEVNQLIEQTAAEPYASDLGGREDIAALYNDFWSRLRSLGRSPPLTSRLMYYPERWNPWRAITASLAHGSWGHLIGNLIFFYLFGSMVEAILGPLLYLGVLLLLAEGTHLVYSMASIGHHGLPSLGLSGVIYGVMSLFAWFMPEAQVRVFWFFLMRFGVRMIPAWFVVAWYVAGDAFSLFTSGNHGGINLVAHVSGAALGCVFGMLFFRGRRQWLREETGHLMVPDR